MNTDRQDEELRGLFQDLRRSDEAAAPSFQRLAAAAAPRQEPEGWRWLRPAALAALAVACAGLALYFPTPPDLAVETQGWSALSNWTPATDTLKMASVSPWTSAWTASTDGWMQEFQSETRSADQKKETIQ